MIAKLCKLLYNKYVTEKSFFKGGKFMQLTNLIFNMKNELREGKEILDIFNMMVNDGNSSRVIVKSDENGNKYVEIDISRCRSSFVSVGSVREVRKVLMNELDATYTLIDGVNYVPENKEAFFRIKNDNEIATSFFEKAKYPKVEPAYQENKEKSDLKFNDCISLDFFARKSFKEINAIVEVANHLFESGAGCYLKLVPVKGGKNWYLSINIMFEKSDMPTLFINFMLLKGTFDDSTKFEMSKCNFMCSNPGVVPIRLEVIGKYDENHGEQIRLHVGEAYDHEERKRLNEHIKILEAISPV